MSHIDFDPTFGSYHESTYGHYMAAPTPEAIQQLLFNLPEEEWAGGSGESVITYAENGEKKSKLVVSAAEGYGFMLHHTYYPSEADSSVVLTEGEHSGETADVYIGGDPVPCFREYLVSKQTAWEAIEYFLNTGQRKERLSWQKHKTPEFASV